MQVVSLVVLVVFWLKCAWENSMSLTLETVFLYLFRISAIVYSLDQGGTVCNSAFPQS